MKKNLLAVALTLVVISLPMTGVSVGAADNNNNDKGTLSVSYNSEKEVAPDTVEVSIAVKTSDKKYMQVASVKNKEISNKIYEYLKSNINTANGDYIKTSNYSATPIYNYKDNKQILDRYEVSNNITVHTKSIDKIAELIDRSLELGATNVNSLNFMLSDKGNYCNDMLYSVGKQVRTRADKVAGAVGTSIVGIKSLNTSCSLNQPRVNYGYSRNMLLKSASMDAAAPEAAGTSIEAGNIKIYSYIDATFYVK